MGRHGLLRRLRTRRHERPPPPREDRPRRPLSRLGQGGRHEMVPNQIRRYHPQLQETINKVFIYNTPKKYVNMAAFHPGYGKIYKIPQIKKKKNPQKKKKKKKKKK